MADSFGYVVCLGSVALGAVLIAFADRINRRTREVNAERFWTKNALYDALMDPRLNTAMLQIIGWTAVVIGTALLVLLAVQSL